MTGSILFGTEIALTRPIRLPATHAPSPDVRYAHPGLRLLDADCASQSASAWPSWLRWSATPAPGAWVARSLTQLVNRRKREGSGLHMPSRGLWKRAQAGCRSERTCSERRTGCPQRTSAERACAAPSRVGRVDSWCQTPGPRRGNRCAEQDWDRLQPVLLHAGALASADTRRSRNSSWDRTAGCPSCGWRT